MKAIIIRIINSTTHITNQSLQIDIIPAKTKIAKGVPIFKYSDQSLLINYRPVSLLLLCSKVLYRARYNQLMALFKQIIF